MKLTVVTENSVLSDNLKAEHGMSMYIEKGDTKMFFDMGQFDAIKHNAKRLGIDFHDVNVIAFSHNHVDHCGGFLSVCDEISSDCRIYAHTGFSTRKWWDHRFDIAHGDDAKPDIELVGPAMPYEFFFMNKKYGFRTIPDDVYEIGDGIYLVGNFPTYRGIEAITPASRMEVNGSDENLVLDEFRDETVCVIKVKDGLVVLSGCAHNGIMNILNTVKKHFPNDKIYAVYGGTHMVPYNKNRTDVTIDYFNNSNICKVGPCHCTGPSIPEFSQFIRAFIKIGAGYTIEFED